MFILEKIENQELLLLIRILKKIFKDPIVAMVEGDWKTGKTDFALFIAEVLLDNDIVDEVASNIYTEGKFPQISDVENLKFWLHRNMKRKLYIFDELNENAPSRRAMSNKSVGIISILPECSKAHARVLGLAQDVSGVDSEFHKSTWVKARFQKFITRESKVKNVRVFSPSFLRTIYEFYDIPRTSITFDPYLLAPFTLKPERMDSIEDEDMNRFYKWCKGLGNENGFKHPQEASRCYRRAGLKLIELYSQITHNSVEGRGSKN